MQEGEITERPLDNKNKIIDQLRKVSTIVSQTNNEQSQREKNHFTAKTYDLLKLGNEYIDWLEINKDKVPDDKTFQAVASLAKSSLLLNVEQYVRTIKGIGSYVQSQPELDGLNPAGKKDGPWASIKEALYYTTFNDVREEFRERLLQNAKELIDSGELTPRQLDHLERFLVDSQKRAPNKFIPEYIAQHAKDLQQWTPLPFDDFQAFVVRKLGDYTDDLSKNDFLKQLDEEIASIKPEDLQSVKATSKTKYTDRAKKVAFIRDLRFGRVNLEKVKAEIAANAAEITNRSDLKKELGPLLKQNLGSFIQELQNTIGQDTQMRKAQLILLARSYGLQQQVYDSLLKYLDKNLH